MAVRLNLFNFVLLLIFVSYGHVKANRLNVPRVLLPIFNDFPVNFTLDVTEGGCYRWSTSRPDIIRLIPVDEDLDQSCSIQVIVQTVTRDLTRKTSIILAEDVATGHILRCDVIVDAISSLNIVTTTRELFIEEAPEAFEVRAYDEQGNEFSTLAGVEFTWTVGNTDKQGLLIDSDAVNSVLHFMTFQGSPYETPNTVAMLDAIGKTGNIVLLEGVKTGTARISTKLMYSEYKSVPQVEVDLIVVANLIIIPSDVTVMAFDNFFYRIVQIHQGRMEEINIPTSQYYLEAENSDILKIDPVKANAYPLKLGRTKVFLHDKNVNEEYGTILPTANVNVAEVSYINIAVLPHRSKSLILGHNHEIIVEMFDGKDHKFFIGEGVEVSMKINNKYFNKTLTTRNGTHVGAIPITVGTTIVEATLFGVINKQGKKIPISALTAKAELVIHSAVAINPKILALPWDPKVKTRYDVALKASGGDGSYNWNSRHPSVVTVSQNGALKILKKGTSEITVSLVRNVFNRDVAKVHVLVPKQLKIIEYQLEAAVGEPIHLHVALYGELSDGNKVKLIPFNDCRELSFDVDIPDGNFVQADTENVTAVDGACKLITISAKSVGVSVVSVTYGRNLTDNITISVYEPLKVIHPATSETLLVVGSSRNVVFKGGPRPWIRKPEGYRRAVKSDKENIVGISEQKLLTDADIFVVKVLCRSLGETNVSLSVWNHPPSNYIKERKAIANVSVICGKPRYIFLRPAFGDSEKCPMTQDLDKIVAHSEEPLKLLATVKDANGKKFDNISSLQINWHLEQYSTANLLVPSGVIEENFMDFQVELPKHHYQIVTTPKYSEPFNLKVKVTGYQEKVLSRQKITPEWPPFNIENERGTLITPNIEADFNIFLVNDTAVNPNQLKILNDPNSKYYLQVNQGSGYYDVSLSSQDIADVRYVELTRTISVIPKKSGNLKVTLTDLCLVSKPAEVDIEVQQLTRLVVETVNKIEKGKYIIAKLKLYDSNGYLMVLPSIDAVIIKIETHNGFIRVKRLPDQEQGSAPFEKILYSIQGMKEGETQLSFTSGQGANLVQSEINIVQVFSPLQVVPRNLTTLVGTIYQISIVGGPKNADIEYLSDDNNVLEISSFGVIEGKSTGTTKIHAKAVGLDSRGKKVVFSGDTAEVQVINLEGIKIVTPTTRVKVGAEIPLWVFGIPDSLDPLIIGSMKSPLIFTWNTSDADLLSLHNMYEDAGVHLRYQNDATLRGRAKKSGSVTVSLTANTPCNVLGGCRVLPSFTSSVKIDIFEELYLTNSDLPRNSLVVLMAPNSMMKLRTNRDKFGLTTYKILSIVQSSGGTEDLNALTQESNNLSVDKNGVLKSGDNYLTSILAVTNVESYGAKQILTVVVHVKPVHYMMINLKSKIQIRSGEELNALPKNMELDYEVKYYDSVGSVFHAAEMDFSILSSRTDLASFYKISKNALTTKLLENGELIVKFYNEKHPNTIFDYARMTIADVLYPIKAAVTVGDVICFSMPLLSPDGDSGYWQTSSPDVVSVDPMTGIGKARNHGTAHIKHSIMTNSQDEIEVSVDPIDKILLVHVGDKNITGLQTFSLPLVLRGKHDIFKTNNILSRGSGGCRTYSDYTTSHFPYTCTIQFSPSPRNMLIKELLMVKPRFDIATGFYYCDVIPTGTLSILGSTIETRIKINALGRDVEATPVEVFYLPPMYIASKEIIFRNLMVDEVPSASLEIYGLPRVLQHINLELPPGISIINHQSLSKNSVQYKFSMILNQEEIVSSRVWVMNELTKQNISLVIQVPRYDVYPRISGIHWLDYLYFHRYTLGTFVILIISFLHFWKNKVRNMNLTVRNKYVFVDPNQNIRKTSTPCPPPPSANVSNLSGSASPGTPIRPFSAFEPVYGDPRGLYTPNARRNRSCL